MGYTHYWTPAKDEIPEAALSIIKLVLEHGAEEKIICTEGDQAWEFSVHHIFFNGIEDDAHETFTYKVGGEWDFCKTARKPYDLYVCATLLVLGYYIPDLNFSSDGGVESDEWGKAIVFLLDKKDKFGLDQNLIDSLFRIRDGEDKDLFEDYPLYLPDSENPESKEYESNEEIGDDLFTYLEIALMALENDEQMVVDGLDIEYEEYERLRDQLRKHMQSD